MNQIKQAITLLKKGGIIAYPTEAVYGLGCDPFQEQAVKRILQLKQRSVENGLIIIAAEWEQIQDWVQPLPADIIAQTKMTWPRPITWVFPASSLAPPWICGNYKTIAIRLTTHPLAHALCQQFGKPLVSTSANITNTAAARDYQQVKQIFGENIDLIIDGAVGDAARPSEIRDIMTGKILRNG